MKLEDVDDDEFLKTGWDDMKGEHIQAYVESNGNGWTADQVGLGFVADQRIGCYGERRG